MEKDEFVERIETRALKGRLKVERFIEPVVYLLDSTTWTPNRNRGPLKFAPVEVPKGFVTDFASIPRIFYSMYRPDGEYAHAAVVHDYLYWAQSVSRNDADEIFKIAMEDLEISPANVLILYHAVATFGASAWENNKRAKAAGEKRILKVFPSAEQTAVRWSQWKKNLNHFAD
jgi:hypothetical protein